MAHMINRLPFASIRKVGVITFLRVGPFHVSFCRARKGRDTIRKGKRVAIV